jgi:hypothetical protein
MAAFHFCQRQGSLNLKSVRAIDLDRVVRETDVDVLQMNIENIAFSELREEDVRCMSDPDVIKLFRISQLMLEYLLFSQDSLAGELRGLSTRYANKKKDLMRKRKEVIELTEATRQLKSDLVTKRRGISSLEDMLKKASRVEDNRSPEENGASSSSGAEAPTTLGNKSNDKTSGVRQFFVTCPDGLSIEYNSRVSMMVYELKGEIRKVLTERLATDSSGGVAVVESIRLVYRGQILADQMSVGESDIRSGDSVVALFTTAPNKAAEGNASSDLSDAAGASTGATSATAVPVAAAAAAAATPELVEILKRQQDMMAALSHALKEKDAAVSAGAVSSQQMKERSRLDAELLGKLDERWTGMEVAMRTQLDAQLSHYQELMKEQSDRRNIANSLRAGDIESDDDGVEQRMKDNVAFSELRGKLQASDSRINSLESVVMTGDERQRALLETIEGLNGELKLLRQQVQMQSSAGDKPSGKKVVKKKRNSTTTEKSGDKPSVLASTSAPARAPSLSVDDSADNVTVMDTSSSSSKKASPTKASTASANAVGARKGPSPPKASPEHVPVRFALPFSPDLGSYVSRYVEVMVKRSLSVDDLLYAIRKGVSETAKVPLARVVLVLRGIPVKTAKDVAVTKTDLSSTTAAALAGEGDLIVTISRKNTMSPGQMDDLVKAECAEIRSQTQANLNLIKSVDSDGMPLGDADVRQSLEAALSSVQGKEGLTDEEYTRARALLEQETTPPTEDDTAMVVGAASDETPTRAADDVVKLMEAEEGGGEEQEDVVVAKLPPASPVPAKSARVAAVAATDASLEEGDSGVMDIPSMLSASVDDVSTASVVSAVKMKETVTVTTTTTETPTETATHTTSVTGSETCEEGDRETTPPREKTASPPHASPANPIEAASERVLSPEDVLRATDESHITMDSFNDSVNSDIREFTASEVISRADEYERMADESFKSSGGTAGAGVGTGTAGSSVRTPSAKSSQDSRAAPGSTRSAYSKASTASPFGALSYAEDNDTADTPVGASLESDHGLEKDKDGSGSLALSDSHGSL